MRWPHVDAFLGLGIDPTTKDASGWKRERVRAVIIDDGQLKIAVERRGGDWFPLHKKLSGGTLPPL